MVGYGKTVFQGTKIETFKVTVLGILPKALADTDLILVKIDSKYLEDKKIGLVAGMSGSPIYFNGKLAGAIAYGWPFTQEPLAGITPIESMLRSAARAGSRNQATMGSPISIQLKSLPTDVRRNLGSSRGSTSVTLEPLGIPVSASGFDASGMSQLQSLFPMLHVVPGGSKLKSESVGPLLPGQSVGAALMEGDLSLMATGTLTYREGNTILGFGHPFLFLGDVDFPLYETYVHYILPSLQLPFKFASALQKVGRVSQDRLYGIGGRLGEAPHMVPLEINVADTDRHLRRRFRVRLIRHPEFTPRLTGIALEQAISATSKLLGESTAHIDYELYFNDHPPIHLKNMVIAEQSVSSILGAELLKPMLRVLENDFERVRLSKIRVRISLESKLSAATLQRVVIGKHHLQPEEPLALTVYLKPYNSKIVERKFKVQLPSDIQGTIQVGVAGGSNEDQLRKMMQQPLPEPMNVDQIINQIQASVPDNSLTIRLTFPRRGIHWAGEDFGNLPQPYADLLKAAGSDPLDFHPDGTATNYEMPWVVVGTDVEEITVGAAKEAPSPPIKPPRFPTHPPELPPPPPGIEEPGSGSIEGTHPLPLATLPSISSLSDSEEHKGSDDRKTVFETISNLKEWQEGTLNQLAISSNGNLFLGPQVKTLARFDENVLWTETRAKNSLYIGTANPGKIYSIDSENRKKLFFDPHAVAVLSLAALPNDELLAGTTGGKLYWIDRKGKIKHHWKINEDYIWQILSTDTAVYIATGSPVGRIYKLDPRSDSPHPYAYCTSAQSHITSLYASADGSLFAGTANDGLLLKINPDGTSHTLYDFDESAILSLGETEDGKLIIGSSGKGKVYLLDHENHVHGIAEMPDEDVTWVGTQGKKILAATGIPARLYAVKPGQAPSLLWDGKPDEQVALRGAQDNGRDFYVSGNHAELLNISSSLGRRGDFISKVFDAGWRVNWGRILWHGTVPEGTDVRVESRTGNSQVPDFTWSPWSPSYPPSGETIGSPGSRYIQFKISLSSTKVEATPHLEAIHYFWRQENLPPSITVSSPQPGDVIGPKTTLHGKIRDRDGDTLKVEVWVQDSKKTEKEPERVFTKLYPIPKSKGEDDLEIPLDMLKEEGHLHLKLTISDSPSNSPATTLAAETVIKDLIYDSSMPTLSITKVEHQKDTVHVEGVARDKTSYIKIVQIQLDDGPWLDTVPLRGLFDSPEAPFSFDIDSDLKAKHIEIRVFDGADNESSLSKAIKDLSVGDAAEPKPKSDKKTDKEEKSTDKNKSSPKSDSSSAKGDSSDKKDTNAGEKKPDKSEEPKTASPDSQDNSSKNHSNEDKP